MELFLLVFKIIRNESEIDHLMIYKHFNTAVLAEVAY